MAGLEDDWYLVEALDPRTFAIGEPRYRQQNWSYLLVGGERSLLFDTGSYYGDITGVVARRAAGQVTALPSHMHYDHLGNVTRFGRVSLPDLPVLRACAEGSVVALNAALFLGESEGRTPPAFEVAEWLAVDGWIDLGGRRVQLLHTPGHSPDSVSLWEPDRNRLLAADYLYRGPLYAQTPGASLVDYLATAERLLRLVGNATSIFGAHADAPEAPRLERTDLVALAHRLETLLDTPPELVAGETETYDLTPRMSLIVGAGALP